MQKLIFFCGHSSLWTNYRTASEKYIFQNYKKVQRYFLQRYKIIRVTLSKHPCCSGLSLLRQGAPLKCSGLRSFRTKFFFNQHLACSISNTKYSHVASVAHKALHATDDTMPSMLATSSFPFCPRQFCPSSHVQSVPSRH